MSRADTSEGRAPSEMSFAPSVTACGRMYSSANDLAINHEPDCQCENKFNYVVPRDMYNGILGTRGASRGRAGRGRGEEGREERRVESRSGGN